MTYFVFPRDRFNRIMARVDVWAEDNTGWDCRAEAVYEVEYLLSQYEYSNMTDDQIFEDACAAWSQAE
jgi:hypothetical protein